MHKRQVTMIIGIMVVAAVVAVFAIVFNSSSHPTEEAATVNTSSESIKTEGHHNSSSTKKAKKVTVKKTSATTNRADKQLDIASLLKDQIDAPKVASIKQDAKTIQVVFKDDNTKTLDEFMAAYARASVTILKAAKEQGMTAVATARQVELEDGTEYALAAKWQNNQIAMSDKLADDASIKDVLLSSDHYAIGGAAWDALTQKQKNDYKNKQQGGQNATPDDDFNQWVKTGIVKNK